MNVYEKFGFRYAPFSDSFEIKEPFMAPSDDSSMVRMKNLIVQGKSFCLVGVPGLGKSMLLKSLISQLDKNQFVPIWVCFGGIKPAPLMREICEKMDIDTSGRVPPINRLRKAVTSRDKNAPFPVIIIDDAHELQKQSFMDLASLMHDSKTQKVVLNVILIGHPNLKAYLNLDVMSAIMSRLSFVFKMQPLSIEESVDFLKYRLKIGQGPQGVFEEEALKLLAIDCNGNRRRLNNLAGLCLDEAAIRDEKLVTVDVVHSLTQKE